MSYHDSVTNRDPRTLDSELVRALQRAGVGASAPRLAQTSALEAKAADVVVQQRTRESRLRAAKREIDYGKNATRIVGDWTRYLASGEVDRGGELTQAALHYDAPQWPSVVREVFADLYQAPGDRLIDLTVEAEQPEASSSEWVRSAVELITEVPEWVDLRARTRGDEWASGFAVSQVAQQCASELSKLMPKTDLRSAHDQLQTMIEIADEQRAEEGAVSQPVLDALDAARTAAAIAGDEDSRAAAALSAAKAAIARSVTRIAQGLVEQIDTTKAAMRALGAGSEFSRGMRVNAPPAALHAALRRNPKLARVAALAGRLKAEAARKQRTKTQYAREEVTSIAMGSDVARLVPSELVYLGDELAELVLLRKLTENAALEYELNGTEEATQGPIIVAIDESGSMNGPRDEWAKAVAITLMDIAARQKREITVLHFNTHVQRRDDVDVKNGLKLSDLEAIVGYFADGGTHIATVVAAAVGIVEQAKAQNQKMQKADLVLISDGEDDSMERVKANDLFPRMKECGMAIHGIVIDAQFYGRLHGACSSYTEITNRDFKREGAIDAVFSI